MLPNAKCYIGRLSIGEALAMEASNYFANPAPSRDCPACESDGGPCKVCGGGPATVKPALTPGSWMKVERGHPVWLGEHECAEVGAEGLTLHDRGDEVAIRDRHGLAALALYRQPFGFTREDADFIAQLWDYSWDRTASASEDAGARAEIERRDAIVAKMRALLPPEEP